MTQGEIRVRRGASSQKDPVVAAQEFHALVYDPEAALTVFFCSSDYDLDILGAELRRLFGDVPLVGCTTGGEIGPAGYLDGSLSGMSLGGPGFESTIVRIDQLSQFEFARGDEAAQSAMSTLRNGGPPLTGANTFAFLLVDGLSMQEEVVVGAIYRNLGSIPLFGGSAGDGTRFGATHVFHEGVFRRDVALLVLVRSEYPFEVFKTEHFVATAEKMVVTGADVGRRVVTEINGEPAAREYARAVGLQIDKLTPLIFASHPVVVTVGGETFVRSIQKVNEDESLTFFCAIDEGIVLTVADGVDMVKNLTDSFAGVRERLGPPTVIIGCDCILRYIEANQSGLRTKIGEVLAENNVVGFATYGEQFNAMHVNQTFTGVAIGARRDHA